MPKILRALMCALVVAGLTLAITPAAEATTVSSAPIDFPTTDGDILTTEVMDLGGTAALAIGGNFTHITRPVQHADGTTTIAVVAAAKNLAVLRIPDGALLYAGNVNSYVRTTYGYDSRLYIGGDFTAVDGVARSRIASIDTNTWKVSPFNPSSGSTVRAIDVSPLRGLVLYGGDGPLRAAAPDSSRKSWTIQQTGGPIRALLTYRSMYLNEDVVYACGQFETFGPIAQHGLVRVILRATGPVVDPWFTPVLRPDSGAGFYGSYDGQECMSLADKQPDHPLIVGWGGASTNGVMAIRQDIGAVWWTWGDGTVAGTPGDAQAVASYGDATWVGYHRGHVNDWHPGWKWYLSQLNSNSGEISTWDPNLSGETPGNADHGNHGVTSLQVDTINGLLIVAGGFTTYGQNCVGSVFPCINAAGSPRQSLALYRIAA